MSIQEYEMREAIKAPYGPKWHAKVDKMKYNQVFAIYTRMKKAGEI